MEFFRMSGQPQYPFRPRVLRQPQSRHNPVGKGWNSPPGTGFREIRLNLPTPVKPTYTASAPWAKRRLDDLWGRKTVPPALRARIRVLGRSAGNRVVQVSGQAEMQGICCRIPETTTSPPVVSFPCRDRPWSCSIAPARTGCSCRYRRVLRPLRNYYWIQRHSPVQPATF